MRAPSFLAAAALVVAIVLSACDSGPDKPMFVVTEPATVALVAERDSLVVDVTSLIQHRDGQALTYSYVSGPPGTRLEGTRLVVPPQVPGTVEAVVRGSASPYASAIATVRATFAYTNEPPLVVTEPATAALIVERDSLVVDLTSVIRHPDGRALSYQLISGPPRTRLTGTTLVIRPQPPGTVEVVVQGSTSPINTAKAKVRATFAYAGKITAVKTFAPVTLDARKDSVEYDLSTYFAAPPGVEPTYTVTGTGAIVSGTRLKVKPTASGTSTIVVRASSPGIEAATATLVLTGNGDWCSTPPPGKIDLLAFSTGQAVRFSLTLASSDGPLRSRSKGTLTWTFQQAACSYGATTFAFTEAEVRSDTLNRLNESTGQVISTEVSTFSETRSYTVTPASTGTLPAFGKYAFTPFSEVPRFIPEAGFSNQQRDSHSGTTVTVWGGTAGLTYFKQDYSEPRGPWPKSSIRSLVRLP